MTLEEGGAHAPLVCEVSRRGKLLVAEPFFSYDRPLTMGRRGAVRAQEGDLVSVLPAPGGRAKLLERLGRPDELEAVLHGVAIEHGAARPFGDETAEEAAQLPREPASPEPGRVDLRHLLTFTIDPPDARDFDDAVSIAREDGGLRIWVHISDVSRFVPAGGALDREAALRGCSVYLPTRVEPMLPERLSAGLCSLQPLVDRMAVTIEIDPAGDVTVYRSVIRSDHRLTYPQVERALSGDERVDADLARALSDAAQRSRELRAARFARGAAAIETQEIEFRIEGGAVRSATASTESVAHSLIEELMLLTNERVAAILAASRSPALHRVHPPPEPEAIERLAGRLAALDVPTPALPELHTPAQAAIAAAALSATVSGYTRQSGRGREAFPQLVLRALERARYDPASLGHSGLSAPAYCHFTSPIRRYPDLVCHRALLAHLGLAEPVAVTVEELADTAALCSEAERRAARIERAGDDVCLAFLLEQTVFHEGWDARFDGEIVGLIPGGLFVRFGDVFEGLLPARALGVDWFDLDAPEVALVGRSSGRRHRLGDRIGVCVRSIDRARGKVLLDLPDALPA